MREFKEKIAKIIIDPGTTLLQALKRMDDLQVKLLLVMQNDTFIGLLSIGDIQRAIIKNVSLDTYAREILRKGNLVARDFEDFESIKKKMLEHRTECMPVLDGDRNLLNVYFWEDVFDVEKRLYNSELCAPVVIMAGGKGSRLQPITNVLPKPLIPVGEKTILEHILDRFVSVSCNKFIMSVNYKADMIIQYFDTLKSPAYEISYVREESFLGTAGSLTLVKGKIDTTFFVSNCDIIIDTDYTEMYNYHRQHQNDITIVGVLKHYPIPYGVLETGEDGRLMNIQEKPELTYKINSGMYILEPSMLDEIPEGKHFHITELIEQVKINGGRVGVFPVNEGAWMDIGEWSEYSRTIKRLGYNNFPLL